MNSWRIFLHDLIGVTPLRWIFHNRRTWPELVLSALLTALLAVGLGWLIAELGVLVVIALTLVLGYGLWMLRDIEVAFWGVIGVVTLLPFASLPFSIGFTPTFLDLAMLGIFTVWIAPIALGRQPLDLVITPLDGPILAFALLAIGSFVAGLSHAALTSYLIRHFAEVLLSIGFFFLIVNTVRDTARLERLTRVFLLAAGTAALLGIALYFIPDEITIRILSALGRFGYPGGAGVLRYIRDDPALMQRATSTSVDPNVLGSLLNLSLVLATPQLFAVRPVIKRPLLAPLMGVIGSCLILTVSRGSLGGTALAIVLLGALRYRKILPLLMLALILLLILPWTQEYSIHFVEGLQGQDLSTKMRFGEYKDTFRLIQRYPLLGVGFGGAPDIDLYVAVASIYLLMAAEMGLVGLAAFLLIVGVLLYRFWTRLGNSATTPRLEALWYGYHGAVIGGLIGGIFDHYFFSLDFHHSVTIFWMFLALATVTTNLLDRAVTAVPAPE